MLYLKYSVFLKVFLKQKLQSMKKFFTAAVILLALHSSLNAQISTFPYVQTGDDPIGWNAVQGPVLWFLADVPMNPGGVINDAALGCNFYAQPSGTEAYLFSPVFNLTNLSKPIIHFYSAHRSYSAAQNDMLEIFVSTDAGSSFASTIYTKTGNSDPSLSTITPAVQEFYPTQATQWRHETIDLSAYAHASSVMIVFKVTSDFGNNLWIDNFIIMNADDYCENIVTTTGTGFCDPAVQINVTALGGAGVMSLTKHYNQYPVPSVAPVNIKHNDSLTGATTADGSRFTPNIVAPDAWYTVSFSGNTKAGYATYNISIDISSFISLIDVGKLYVLKRSDFTGSWVCLNTTTSSGYLIATGLTTFSDFAIGGDSLQNPLPVELASFTSTVNARNVTLNWSTSSEINNSGFDIERSGADNMWSKVGYVAGHGTSQSPNSYTFTDANLNSGKYSYRLKQTDFNGNFEYFSLSSEVIVGVPGKFDLSQNYPNPFNPSTKINYQITDPGNVLLKVYDLSGKEAATLVSEKQEAGYYTVTFDASGLSSGIYFYKLTSNNFTATKRMMLIK